MHTKQSNYLPIILIGLLFIGLIIFAFMNKKGNGNDTNKDTNNDTNKDTNDKHIAKKKDKNQNKNCFYKGDQCNNCQINQNGSDDIKCASCKTDQGDYFYQDALDAKRLNESACDMLLGSINDDNECSDEFQTFYNDANCSSWNGSIQKQYVCKCGDTNCFQQQLQKDSIYFMTNDDNNNYNNCNNYCIEDGERTGLPPCASSCDTACQSITGEGPIKPNPNPNPNPPYDPNTDPRNPKRINNIGYVNVDNHCEKTSKNIFGQMVYKTECKCKICNFGEASVSDDNECKDSLNLEKVRGHVTYCNDETLN